jgi:ABC-type sugar transport system ATPase subunit
VLLISSELDEILALADRVAVMYRGGVVGVVAPSAGRERIGLMMAGAAGGKDDVLVAEAATTAGSPPR